MRVRAACLGGLLLLSVGCADWNTVSRRTPLPGSGVAIHLDAAQRVVYANSDGAVCAEPSPDALQAYAASLGASGATPSHEAIGLAAAFSENSASIGLRTQSITLMRDALYRVCEAEHNKAIGRGDVIMLLERSQDLTLGVLAIEQLTGAVVAKQALLTTGTNANAAANVNNTQAALDAARKDEAAKKDALDKATTAQTNEKAVVDTATKTAAASKTKAATAQATVDKLASDIAKAKTQLTTDEATATKDAAILKTDKAKVGPLTDALAKAKAAKPPVQAAIDKATADLKAADDQVTTDEGKLKTAQDVQTKQQAAVTTAEADLKKAQDDPDVVQAAKDAKTLATDQVTLKKDDDTVTADKTAYDTAQKVTLAIQANLDAAIASAQTVANGFGELSNDTGRDNINKDTVGKIADATTAIVQSVLNKGHLTDACVNLFATYSSGSIRADDKRSGEITRMMDLCQSIIDADLRVFEKNPGSGQAILDALK